MGRKVVPPNIVFKQVGTPEEIDRALTTAYNRIFTIAAQNIRAMREKERLDKDLAVENKDGGRTNP
ncbi:hypothetical protein IPM62_05950 [Candidatus Woesebacteria bacterium]|nr:MAG: hypothetical protein IPM62_05950 [Candidatus Woesebacteria bacterium]